MSSRDFHAPVWFVAALIPMVASQIVRLQQSDPGSWIFLDYSGRLGTLAMFAAIPSVRMVAFCWEKLQIALWEVALWMVGLVITDHYLGGWIGRTINAALPATVLGTYPRLSGWLYFADVVFGMALVAYSEEIVFRRCARHIFKIYMDDGYGLVVITSLLFGAYHWWTGLGNIVQATMMGVLLMLFFRRSAALWPVVLAHYLIDVADFA
jgi:membrane protease YdiL (CAAX protease family)